MKNFGIKCAFIWKNDKGSVIGIEERILLVKAMTANEAFKIVERKTKNENNRKAKNGDWTIRLIQNRMDSYEMFEIDDRECIEVYSCVHRNRKSVKRTITNWFTNGRG